MPRSGRCPGGGNGNQLQYSCLRNPTDKGAWWATVSGVAKESDMTAAKQEQEVGTEEGHMFQGKDPKFSCVFITDCQIFSVKDFVDCMTCYSTVSLQGKRSHRQYVN